MWLSVPRARREWRMAVYKRSYHGYAGPVTRAWSRFAILHRYAYRDLFHSKIMTAFFVLCFAAPLVYLLLIYFVNNFASLGPMFQSHDVRSPITIDGDFFLSFLNLQGVISFILTAFVGSRHN